MVSTGKRLDHTWLIQELMSFSAQSSCSYDLFIFLNARGMPKPTLFMGMNVSLSYVIFTSHGRWILIKQVVEGAYCLSVAQLWPLVSFHRWPESLARWLVEEDVFIPCQVTFLCARRISAAAGKNANQPIHRWSPSLPDSRVGAHYYSYEPLWWVDMRTTRRIHESEEPTLRFSSSPVHGVGADWRWLGGVWGWVQQLGGQKDLNRLTAEQQHQWANPSSSLGKLTKIRMLHFSGEIPSF